MEEIEVPVEQLQETIHEKAHEAHEAAGGGHGGKKDSLSMQVALSSALIAVLAAVTAMLAGHHVNEAMIEQLRASDQWNFYQAKSIKATLLVSVGEMRKSAGQPARPEDEKKVEEYKHDQEAISEKAKELQTSSDEHLRRHQILARAVTLFQVGIAMSAIAVLTRKRRLWLVSLLLGIAGAAFFAQGLI